jgi:hypothetical protein
MEKSELIFKVLSSEASSEEVKELDDWISLNASNKNEYEDLKLLWEGSREVNVINRDDTYRDGFQKIRSIISKRKRKKKWLTAGIVILVAMAIMAIPYYLISSNRWQVNKNTSIKFNQVPLLEVIAVLEKEYSIEIIAPTKILDCEFTGSFYNDSAKDVVRSIAESMSMEYNRVDDNTFKLNGSGCTK